MTNTEDWATPTAYLRRLGDALQLLCGGKRPTDKMMSDWLDTTQDSIELQEFCSEHGPTWGQGIGVIDAAMTLADQPTEGPAHEYRAERAAPEVVISMKRSEREGLSPEAYAVLEAAVHKRVALDRADAQARADFPRVPLGNSSPGAASTETPSL